MCGDNARPLERLRVQQVYTAYYASRTPEEEAEERALLTDFAITDTGIELATNEWVWYEM